MRSICTSIRFPVWPPGWVTYPITMQSADCQKLLSQHGSGSLRLMTTVEPYVTYFTTGCVIWNPSVNNNGGGCSIWTHPEAGYWDWILSDWVPFQYQYYLTNIGFPIIKIRWSHDHLIFIMGNPILVRWHLHIKIKIIWFWNHLIFIMGKAIQIRWCLHTETTPGFK